jgi:hypothetical protein
MNRFSNDREALDFVASRIADEAQRDGAPLSEVERKMLYFSETAWTLPDIADVNDKFDSEYDQETYEKRIAKLIRTVARRDRKQSPEEFAAWHDAIQQLGKSDRYLLVMVKQAGLGRSSRPANRPFSDSWKLLVVGCTVVGYFLGFVWVLIKFHLNLSRYSSSPKDFVAFALWAAAVCAVVLYGVLRLVLGARRFDGITDRLLEWMAGISKTGS